MVIVQAQNYPHYFIFIIKRKIQEIFIMKFNKYIVVKKLLSNIFGSLIENQSSTSSANFEGLSSILLPDLCRLKRYIPICSELSSIYISNLI